MSLRESVFFGKQASMSSSFACSLKALLALDFTASLICIVLRILFFKKYNKLLNSSICIYTSCYGGYDNFLLPCQQTLPAKILFFGDAPPFSCSESLDICIRNSEFANPRHAAKFYKICSHVVPEIAGFDITVWIDSSCLIRSKYFLEILLMSSDAPIAMRRHPDRCSIISESVYSESMSKYSDSDLVSQAEDYIYDGMTDDHLWHCALIVRYASQSVVCFNKAWWHEMSKSLQDQISAPYAEYVSGLRISPIPRWLNWFRLFSFDTSHRNHEYLPD